MITSMTPTAPHQEIIPAKGREHDEMRARTLRDIGMAIQDPSLCMDSTIDFVERSNLNISIGGEEVNINATIGGGTVRLNVSVGPKEVHINVMIVAALNINIRMIVSLEGKPMQMKVTELPGSSSALQVSDETGKDAKDKGSLTYSSAGYHVTLGNSKPTGKRLEVKNECSAWKQGAVVGGNAGQVIEDVDDFFVGRKNGMNRGRDRKRICL